jgi:hypothetical protein
VVGGVLVFDARGSGHESRVAPRKGGANSKF